jgi:hypothetical protein
MKSLPMLFVNDAAEVIRLVQLVTRLELPPFKSVMVHGSLAHPAQMDLYKSVRPPYNEHPVCVVVRDSATGDFRFKEDDHG